MRINQLLLFIFFLIITFSFVSAITDVTPPDDGEQPISDNQVLVPLADYSKNIAMYSKIDARLTELDQKLNNTMTKDDIKSFKEEINADFDYRTGIILGRMLALLLVWQVFFFATLLIGKSKRWF